MARTIVTLILAIVLYLGAGFLSAQNDQPAGDTAPAADTAPGGAPQPQGAPDGPQSQAPPAAAP
ncbi:MAG: hypothetical protein J6S75_12655, partial [Thermoguttaceae bacterium]|nr:hypothetical protein [Thermoguttaceae bacterium]